jgi:NAD(P)H-flavin reductase
MRLIRLPIFVIATTKVLSPCHVLQVTLPVPQSMGDFQGSISQTFRSALFDTEGPKRGSNGTHSPFEPLLERVEFSRRFIHSYNLVVVFTILIVAAARNRERWNAKQRQIRLISRSDGGYLPALYTNEGCSSDSSSTLSGNATPPDIKAKVDIDDENQPLLGPFEQNRVPPWALVVRRLRAFLAYQPRPLPYLNKVLPDNGTTLSVLALFAINIFYCLYGIPMEGRMLFVYADRFGCAFMVNLPLLYLIAAKNQPIKQLTGHSYESLNIFHRRLGELMCLLALLHALGTLMVWYTLLRPLLHISLWHFLTNNLVLLGLGTFICYEALYFTSLGSFRQRWYELFLVSHIVLQLAALIFLWFHYHTSRPYVAIAFAIVLADRILFRILLRSTTLQASLTVLEDKETVLVSTNWAIATSYMRSFLPQSTMSGWKPTDHVFLSIPALSPSAVLQAHPFTIASASPNLAAQDQIHAWLSLLIRGRDGFSKHLLEYAYENDTVQVRLDGPYGTSRPLEILEDSELAIVVAGGSGIAVAFPLIWALLQPDGDSENTENVALQRLIRTKRKVCLLWVIHSRSHLSWLPKERLDELREWGLDLCITAPTAELGRPDVPQILDNWVYKHGGDDARIGVVVSGPDGMNRTTRNACSAMLRNGQNVQVLVEKFGW